MQLIPPVRVAYAYSSDYKAAKKWWNPVCKGTKKGEKITAGSTLAPSVLTGMSPDGTLVIAFRGTVTYNEWQHNYRTKQKLVDAGDDVSDVRVHQGFFELYTLLAKGLWEDMIPDNIATSPDISQVIITGHSLGGALATLSLANLLELSTEGSLPSNHFMNRKDTVVSLVTFGQPRVGNDAFRSEFLANKYAVSATVYDFRSVNKADPVPRIPLYSNDVNFFRPYWHLPQQIWYPNSYACSAPCGREMFNLGSTKTCKALYKEKMSALGWTKVRRSHLMDTDQPNHTCIHTYTPCTYITQLAHKHKHTITHTYMHSMCVCM